MSACAVEVTWLIGLYKELGVSLTHPIKMVCDSKTAIQIASNPIFHERTKHIDIDCHFVRERICQVILKTKHINTKMQPADLLTKSLDNHNMDY